MIPLLFDSFDTVGADGARDYIGQLTHCTKCLTKEDRNGEYTIELETTVNDPVASALLSQRIIKAKPNPSDSDQCFEIQSTTRKPGGIIAVTAKHVRNFLYQLASEGDDNYADHIVSYSLTPSGVWNKLFEDYITDSTPFSFYSDINTIADFYLGFNEPKTLGAIFGGEEGSLIDMYDGELKFSNYTVRFLSQRGKDIGYQLRYGKNISSAEQSENCIQTYSHILPYGRVVNSSGRSFNLYGSQYEIPNNECKYKKILPLDCSDAVKTIQIGTHGEGRSEALALMTAYAARYARANRIGKVSVSIKVDTQAQLQSMQEIGLCDIVTVILDNYGVSTQAKIVSATYNTLLERWESLTVGTQPISLASLILNKRKYNL